MFIVAGMIKIGLCTAPANTPALRDAGFDYFEGGVIPWLQGLEPDETYPGPEAYLREAVLPAPTAAVLLPGDLKIVGPAVDEEKVRTYMQRVARRAGQAKMAGLVFGSGGARTVPEGFPHEKAREQLLSFMRMIAGFAKKSGITFFLEPLNRGECNIITQLDEAAGYVREVDHPNFRLLVDSYHFWNENEPLSHLEEAVDLIHHVHVADKTTRRGPGEDPQQVANYRDFLGVLKRGGYDQRGGRVSIEGAVDVKTDPLRSYADLLREQWEKA